jgi:hypothetical protein
MDTTTEPRLDPRRREAHPERIRIGGESGEIFVRNDVLARELGESERSLNRRDKFGAPHVFLGGIKYRPEKRYAEFILASIRVRRPAQHKQTNKTRKRRKWSP